MSDKTRLRFESVIALIFSEGERTRRHFDIVAEGMKSERLADLERKEHE
ncbi:MAG: hypothetical protein M3545_08930 [Acidobacteriota bacterium]|nr:hypothetical protein [Acidobacteriota bacterium]